MERDNPRWGDKKHEKRYCVYIYIHIQLYLGLHYQHPVDLSITLNDKHNLFKETLDLDFYDQKGMTSSESEAKVASPRDA